MNASTIASNNLTVTFPGGGTTQNAVLVSSNLVNSNTIQAKLEGTLFAKNAIGTTVRMHVRYYDVHDSPQGSSTGAELGSSCQPGRERASRPPSWALEDA